MSAGQSKTVVEFGPFTFDCQAGKLSKHGLPIRLRGMPLKILQCLVERADEVVSRGELQKALWQDTAFGDFEQGLNTAVNVARRALGDSADQPRYIETVPGRGYRFIAPLRNVTDAEPSPPVPVRPARTTKPFPKWPAAVIVVALAILGGQAWRMSRPVRSSLMDGSVPSTHQDANDQYNLAFNFLAFQNDILRARQAFERALKIDPEFGSALLQRACIAVIGIYNGHSIDEGAILQAEQDLHRAERTIPATDGLLLSTQAAVYFIQGRLDRVPRTGLNDWWQSTGGRVGSPVWVVIFQMLAGETAVPQRILRAHLERNPQEGPARMFLGELQRTKGDTAEAVKTLELTLEQGPRHAAAIFFLSMAYLDLGKPEQARSLLEQTRADLEKNYLWRFAWAMVLAAQGKHDEARLAMDEDLLKFARLNWTVTSPTAEFFALQGEPSKAIEWLQIATARGDERVEYFRRSPRLAALRTDPTFRALMDSIAARRR